MDGLFVQSPTGSSSSKLTLELVRRRDFHSTIARPINLRNMAHRLHPICSASTLCIEMPCQCLRQRFSSTRVGPVFDYDSMFEIKRQRVQILSQQDCVLPECVGITKFIKNIRI